jgi:prepilin-type N-terminal cleavage/methylation domain-containing protein
MTTLPNKTNRRETGFTLIELLVVIGILAVLLAIVLIAINPARQFQQANDTRRRSEITQILNAIGQYAADNRGQLPPGMPAVGTPDVIDNGLAGFCAALVPTYISALPVDPRTGDNDSDPAAATGVGQSISNCAAAAYTTGYQVQRDANNRVTVRAEGELDADLTNWDITVTR